MQIQIGAEYRFAYPEQFVTLPEYSAHRGAAVRVLRQLTDDECDPEQQPMFKVQADDGWIGDAWGDELQPLR